ncbi:MAG: aldolase/citrate lyase family protein [Rhodobacter sp.]|nr:aldolase/citrate lyase family protein [Rhodobacter sp.]
MRTGGFRQRMLAGEILAGTFLKTPAYEMVEVLALSGLDFVCLDAEHAPFDRGRLDACLALARALDFPALVRVGSGSAENILQALDSGAVGLVVPHVFSVERAEEIARAARFGHHGRGYAGSTRWAGYTARKMPDLLTQSRDETVVIAQIEEPEGVRSAADIAAVTGIDGLFVGPADLSVAYGKTDQGSEDLLTALRDVGTAAQAAGKAYMSFVPDVAKAKEWAAYGMTTFFLASEQSWVLAGARGAAQGVHSIRG